MNKTSDNQSSYVHAADLAVQSNVGYLKTPIQSPLAKQ